MNHRWMNHSKTLILCSWLGLLALSGCGSVSTPVDGTHVYHADQQCPALLNLKIGETLELRLAENPATGYHWSVMQHPSIFKLETLYLQADAENAQHDSAQLNAAGEKTFRFRALQVGEGLIHLKQVRAGEPLPLAEWKCRVRVA